MKNFTLISFLSFLSISSAFTLSNWVDFAVDKELTVKLPAKPLMVHKDTIEADGFEQHLRIASISDNYGQYIISRDDLRHESDNYLTPEGRREWYLAGPVIEGAVYQAKFLERETFKVAGVEGIERTYEIPASQNNGHTIKYVRTLLVGKVGYYFSFMPKDGFKNPCLTQKQLFFESIKLQR